MSRSFQFKMVAGVFAAGLAGCHLIADVEDLQFESEATTGTSSVSSSGSGGSGGIGGSGAGSAVGGSGAGGNMSTVSSGPGGAGGSGAGGAPAEIPKPTHYWTFDEVKTDDKDSVVIDLAGGFALTCTENVKKAQKDGNQLDSMFGVAAAFDGNLETHCTRQGDKTDHMFKTREAFSVSLWWKNTPNEVGTFFGKRDPSDKYRGVSLGLSGANSGAIYGSLGLTLAHKEEEAPGKSFLWARSTEQYDKGGEWRHTLVVYDPKFDGDKVMGSSVSIYVDGTLLASITEADHLKKGPEMGPGEKSYIDPANAPFRVGVFGKNDNLQSPYKGAIDDMALWMGQALGALEADRIFKRGKNAGKSIGALTGLKSP